MLLLIEVGDTSLTYDRDVKLPLYAAGEVPEVWLVDLPETAVEVYREPAGESYRWKRRALPGETLEPGAPRGVRLEVDELFDLG